jgi:CBS domain-containing protein
MASEDAGDGLFAVHCLLTKLASGRIVVQTRDRELVLRGRNQGKEIAMIVKNILAGKHGNVVTVEPTADLAAAVKLLTERHIGAVVILGADHQVIGILSERDIVWALAEHGAAALSKAVSQVMTRDVKTCSEDDAIGDLMGRMTTGKFRHMPVVQQGNLIGIVSIGDVVKSRVEEIDHEAKALRDYIQTA